MEDKQTNPAQIVLIIAGVLLVIVGLGWFLLDTDPGIESPAPPRPVAPVVDKPIPASPESVAADDASGPNPAAAVNPAATSDQAGAASGEIAEPEPRALEVEEQPPVVVSTVEADLRKARMAAEADVLVLPAEQSALYFYAQVLEAQPDHAIARAELDSVLGRLAVRSSAMLENNAYQQASDLAEQVSVVAPDHTLVSDVRQAINQVSGERVATAMEQAGAGDEELALAAVAEAESLPGANSEYLQAIRESIADLLQAQADAQAQAEMQQRESRARATADWMERARAAVAEGPLVGPAEGNARAIIEEGNGGDEIAAQLEEEWLDAVLAAASARLEEGELGQAEVLVDAAEQTASDAEEVIGLRASLERAYVARESARVVPVAEMVAINRVAATYPLRASERGVTGWVDVAFTVTPAGTTSEIEITDTESSSLFNSAVIDAVSQWTFEPKEYRGQLIDQRVSARLAFTLD